MISIGALNQVDVLVRLVCPFVVHCSIVVRLASPSV
jgi:hypothetical protein